MLNNIKIGIKLTLGFAAILVLLVILTAVVINSYSKITRETESLLASFQRVITINKSIEQANRIRTNFFEYLGTHNTKLLEAFDSDLETCINGFQHIHDTTPIKDNEMMAGQILEKLRTVRKGKADYIVQEKKLVYFDDAGEVVAIRLLTNLKGLGLDLRSALNKNEIEMPMDHLADLLRCEYTVAEVLWAYDNFSNLVTEEDRRKFETLFQENMNRLTREIEKVKPTIPPGEFSTRFPAVIEDCKELGEITVGYIENLNTLRSLEGPILSKIQESLDLADKMLTNNVKAANDGEKSQQSLVARSRTVCYGVALTAVLIGVVIGFLLTQNMVSGISRVTVATQMIADEGNVNFEIPLADLNRSDEIGEMARAFKHMLEQLQCVERLANGLAVNNYNFTMHVRGELDTVNAGLNKMLDQVNATLHEINNGVFQVTTSSGEIMSASQSLASGAQEAAASLEQIAASMGEISNQTKTNAENAGQARDLALKASQAAGEGEKEMKKMTEAMQRITKNSAEIQKVIKVIDDIAFQTNLLALNAAVEAARAGQHGKGFAVVAEEVRNLASRSAKAAQETSELIAKSGDEIGQGAEVASRTANVLNAVVEQIKQTTDLVAGIAAASTEQAQGVNQITIGLQQIDIVTQQNTTAAEETASAANEMRSMAANLQNLVGQFQLR